MATTSSELIVARSYIGTTEDDDTFNERFDRHYATVIKESTLDADAARRTEALNRSVEESLRAQLAALSLDSPSSASAEGNSYSNVQNLITLRDELKSFRATKGTSTVRSTRLVRPECR